MASTQTLDIGGSEDVSDRLDAIEANQLVIIERLEDIFERLNDLSLYNPGFSEVTEL
jgi:hypothetical protein